MFVLGVRQHRSAHHALQHKAAGIDIVIGEPVPRILEAARRIAALFILMPAHGKSPLKRFLFGTTTLGVLHGADCPVWFMSSAARRNPPEWAAA